MKVSIIIPIYNVAPYVEACLQSVFNQTYQNIEILLVDDCGTDDSMDIVTNLIKGYNGNFEIKVLHHPHNKGLSAARNTGIKAASGEYLYFLDSDDTISNNCIELLIKPIQKYHADFVIANYKVVGTTKRYPPLLLKEEYLKHNENIISAYAKGEWYMMAWNKLINKDFIYKNNLFFKESVLHEDELWSFQLACCSQSMYIIQYNTYFYYIRENSITTNYKKKNYLSLLSNIIECCNWTKKYHLENNLNIYSIIENLKNSLIYKSLNNHEINSYNLYLECKKYFSCNKITIHWILSNKPARIIKDIHYLLPTRIGYYYLITLLYFLYRKHQ